MPHDNRLKVLFFIESLQCGGAERSLVSLLQLLDYSRLDVDLMLLRRGGVFADFVPKEVNVIDFPASRSRVLERACQGAYALKWRLLPMLGVKRHNAENRWPLVKLALRPVAKHYDVAIAYQQGFPTYFIASKVKADKKLAWVNIDLEGAGYREAFNRRFYDVYDYAVAVSGQLYDTLRGADFFGKATLTTVYDILNVDVIRRMGISAERVFAADANVPTAGNGADANVPTTSNGTDGNVPTAGNGANGNVLRLVTVGRLSYQKNYLLAVETANVLRTRGVAFEWIFVGEGAERPAIEALIDRYGLRGYVRLAGLQANPYMFMAQADIYVHTARFEGYGLTIAEAKILGKPVVSTNFRIVYDQIVDGVNGIIAQMDANSLADKIMLLADDDVLRRRIVDSIRSETNTTASTEVAKFYSLIGLEQ